MISFYSGNLEQRNSFLKKYFDKDQVHLNLEGNKMFSAELVKYITNSVLIKENK